MKGAIFVLKHLRHGWWIDESEKMQGKDKMVYLASYLMLSFNSKKFLPHI